MNILENDKTWSRLNTKEKILVYLDANAHYKNNPISRERLSNIIGVQPRALRRAIAKIDVDSNYDSKVSFNSNGIFLTKYREDLEIKRQRAVRAIRLNVERIKELDRIKGLEGQLTYDIETALIEMEQRYLK